MIHNGTYHGLPCVYIYSVPHTPRALVALLLDLARLQRRAREFERAELAAELAADLSTMRRSVLALEGVAA